MVETAVVLEVVVEAVTAGCKAVDVVAIVVVPADTVDTTDNDGDVVNVEVVDSGCGIVVS